MGRLLVPLLLAVALLFPVSGDDGDDLELDGLIRAAQEELAALEEQISREESRIARLETQLVELRQLQAIRSSASSAFRLGEELYESGSIVWARDAFEAVIENFPESDFCVQALFRLELICFELQDFEQSLAYFGELRQRDPVFEHMDLALITAALSNYSTGEFPECRRLLGDISPTGRFDVLADYLTAVAFVEEGQVDAARETLENILSRAGTHREEAALADRARIALAEIMVDEESFEEALDQYDRISPFSPYYDIGMLGKVWVLMRQEEYQSAYNLAERVLREVPSTELRNEFDLAMANCALGAEDLDVAIARYRQLMNEHRQSVGMQELFLSGSSTEEQYEEERERLERIRLGLAELKAEAYSRGDLEAVEMIEREEEAIRQLFVSISAMEAEMSLPVEEMSTESMIRELNRLISVNRDQTEALAISVDEVERLASSSGNAAQLREIGDLEEEVDRIRLALQDLASKFETGLTQSHEWLQETQYGIAIATYMERELRRDSLNYLGYLYQDQIRLAEGQDDSIAVRNLQAERQRRTTALQQRIDASAIECAELLEEYLASFPESRFTADILVRLAQLYYDIDKAAYLDMIASSTGETFVPEDYTRSVELYQRVLDNYPGSDVEDVALYSLGYCLQKMGDPAGAVANYRRLLAQYPQSALAAETNIRAGDFYFESFEFDSAEVYYTNILDHPGADPDLYQLGIYKLGWTYYLLNDYKKSVAVFAYLIRDSQRMEELGVASRSGAMVNEAMEYMAHDFMEQGQQAPVSLATRFLDRFGDEDVGYEVLSQMGVFYQEQGYWVEAIGSFEALLDRYPNAGQAPYLQARIALCYEGAGDLEMANQAREELIENYSYDSEWASLVGQEVATAAIDSLRGQTLRQAVLYYHQQAVALKDEDPSRSRQYWRGLAERAGTYLQEYPDSREAHEFRFILGDAYYSLGDYVEAGDSYMAVATDSTSMQNQENALNNACASYFSAYTDVQGIDSTLVRGKLEAALALYVDLYPEGENVQLFLYNLAGYSYDADDFATARTYYRMIYDDYPSSEYVARSARMIAAAYELDEMYGEAETWYERAAAAARRTGEDLGEDFELLAASAAYRDAESLAQSEDVVSLLTAAARFEESARAHAGSAIAPVALYDAGETYAKAGDLENSVRCFRDLSRVYPENELAPRGLLRAAVLAYEAADYVMAGNMFLEAHSLYPESPELSGALYNAALSFEEAGRTDLAVQVYDRIVAERTGSAQVMVEIAGKYGEYLYEHGLRTEASEMFRLTIEVYDMYRAGEVYYPGMAAFRLGEQAFESYRSVTATVGTAAQKTQLMQETESWYTKTLNYWHETWFMAACVRAGELYEDFANSIGFMDPPADLVAIGPDAVDAFYAELYPVMEQYLGKALTVYQLAVEKAISAGIMNAWVIRAADHLELMMPGAVQQMGGLPGYGPAPEEAGQVEEEGVDSSESGDLGTDAGSGTGSE
ncbi:tetratricopeptide repeat protein [Candidatus Fermentibacterales bacterium]|nr:tetratricopeptide repeat protein [Candidatus Fermentibacterales bacterium]